MLHAVIFHSSFISQVVYTRFISLQRKKIELMFIHRCLCFMDECVQCSAFADDTEIEGAIQVRGTGRLTMPFTFW